MASLTALSKSNTSFALALFKELGDNDKTANIFYSPFSISSALAMVLLGASGNTAMQMRECLGVKDSQDDSNFSQLLGLLNKKDVPYALSVANRLYGDKSYTFDQTFLGSTGKHCRAELEPVDFRTAAEASRININSWVEKQTQGKIKDLLIQGIVTSDTRLVLVNAIYFKGKWKKQFKESDTELKQFRVNKNERKPVQMMHQKSKFPLAFIHKANCQILELPYIGEELSMLIFLPNGIEDNTTGLEKLEKQLTYDNLIEWTDGMDVVDVQVGLPRFKLEQKFNMKSVLVRMGMVDAFDVAMSDFSGMSTNNDLVLSEVVHKAFVDVNEEGTEAAAATAVIMMLRSACLPETFYADHPFLFFIRHNPSKSILFAGRYCSPE